jgi:hypothetical protein
MQEENRDEGLAALTLGVGGTATAAVLVTSADIEDDAVRGVDIHDETIRSRDVDDGALSGVDVARNSLTGADVNEASLGKVPDANRLDGWDSTQFVRKAESFTRHFTCAGTAFESSFGDNDYSLDVMVKYGEGPHPAPFRCSVNIPDGGAGDRSQLLGQGHRRRDGRRVLDVADQHEHRDRRGDGDDE